VVTVDPAALSSSSAWALSDRRGEAARNDGRILDAAREVFLADPGAPVAAVAHRAGVGISALYRRYENKEDLLRALARDALARYIGDLQATLADDGDPWTVYCDCLARIVEGRSQALAQRLAGTFTPTPELGELARQAHDLAERVYHRAVQHDVLRPDVTAADIVLVLVLVLVLEMIMIVSAPGPGDGAALRRRYLQLTLQALRAPGAGPLPGPAAQAEDLAARWQTRRD
jgi:AcrR family transcriptional regulator